ncbi:FliM family flagellar motor switch protein [Wigglesworthia glossinidia endosymbiont of Glossina morsitans morsitans (Yale colony)]|uniref:Flagellar motor switch protein FliM n=1 Tax=Wigglesworthia glossinidia endosymbiont of Glossina morsitans morsitans (Yale colony) TaxID=1142511 RepID=H6Q5L4_WIGGL|nr:FliM/FliN family flagellar motor switch protein [Wigglesworthia glossinidia]AFA40918.1 FliM family flagellar motor switch protein [Wigglesworthia glossinidia endosymbiont of Glossina morsitans morsitans (Yale colony)]
MSDQQFNIDNKKNDSFLNLHKNFSLNINKLDKKNQLKVEILQKINQKFSGYFKSMLSNYIKKSVEITLNKTDIQKYCSFIKQFKKLISLNITYSNALKANIILILDPIFISIVLEIFFGGSGNNISVKEIKKFTISENRIIQTLINLMIKSYQKSWETSHYSIDINFISSDTCIKIIEFENEEDMLISSFKFTYKNIENNFFIIFSSYALEISDNFNNKKLSKISKNSEIKWKKKLSNEIQSSELNIQVRFSEVAISIANLIKLKKGEIIPFSCSEKLTAYVDCVPVFSGYYGSLNGYYALKIDNTIHSSINELKKQGSTE